MLRSGCSIAAMRAYSLVSAHVAEDLRHYRHWQPCLHDLGECEVKHGLRLHLFNFYKDNLGNPQVPEKLRRKKRWKQAATVYPISAQAFAQVRAHSCFACVDRLRWSSVFF